MLRELAVVILTGCSDYGVSDITVRPDSKPTEDTGAPDTDSGQVEDSGTGGDTDATDTFVPAPDCREDYADAVLISFESVSSGVYEIGISDGSATMLSTIDSSVDPAANLNSSAFRSDGLAYVSASGLGELLLVDPCTGAVATVGPTNAGDVCGIAFGPGGLLYGLDKSADELVVFNLTTGNAAPIGPIGIDLDACGLAFDCVNDQLIGVDGATDQLFSIDNTTGLAFGFVPTTVPFSSVGVEYDPRDQTILATTGSELYRIDARAGSNDLLATLLASAIWDDLAYSLSPLPCTQ